MNTRRAVLAAALLLLTPLAACDGPSHSATEPPATTAPATSTVTTTVPDSGPAELAILRACALVGLGRFDDATRVLQEAQANGITSAEIAKLLYITGGPVAAAECAGLLSPTSTTTTTAP